MAKVKKSPWLLHYDGSSCNGCDIETLACLTPVYDAERFGVVNTGDPLQADIFLITGGINTQNKSVVEQLYQQMPRPKVVVAVGTCACTGGIFKDCYNILGGADQVIPVDIYVPGCAARPQAIIDGIIQAVALFQKRSDEHEEKRKERPMAIIIKKEPEQKTITIAELLPEVIAIRKRGMRVCQICAAWVNAQFELSYSFANDGNYQLLTLRVVIDKDVAVPSITPIYPSAVFYENEMKELFGVKVENISTDYRDKFYRIEEKTPFGPESEGE